VRGLIYSRVPFFSMSVERTLIAVLLEKMAAININSNSVDHSFHESMSIRSLIHMSSDPMDFGSVKGGVHFVRRHSYQCLIKCPHAILSFPV
jgi:hypothetical protein